MWWGCLLCSAVLLGACGGGSTGEVSALGSTQAVPSVPVTALGFSTKSADLSWPNVGGATYYEVYEAPALGQALVLLGTTTQASFSQPIALFKKINASYNVKACNAAGCSAPSANLVVSNNLDKLSKTIGYIKASNTGATDGFGYATALSADGNTLAVGAYAEDSAATGINGNGSDNTAPDSGAVYVFGRTVDAKTNARIWVQQAYIKASNTEAGDNFGAALAISADGNTLAVGAYNEDSAATHIQGDPNDNQAKDSGAVYVFSRALNTSTWTQQAYIKASNAEALDNFGVSVALSGDGNTLVVAASAEDSAATGIDGDQSDNSVADSGAVYVFGRAVGSDTWTQQAYIKASHPALDDEFGISLSLSADGNTLAVAAYAQDSAAIGIDGDQGSTEAPDSGAVYVFVRTVNPITHTSTWAQQAFVKASNTGAGDYFGVALALSADGNTLAVGAHREDGAATGVNGNDSDNQARDSGAAYVFVRSASDQRWTQQAYIKASNTGGGDQFGYAIALSGDGNTLAVGAYGEDSRATGVNGNESDNGPDGSGAVYVFTHAVNSTTWAQQAYVKSSNAEGSDFFGVAVALSGDGNTLAVGAYFESSAATGINGNQSDNSAPKSGAVYLY